MSLAEKVTTLQPSNLPSPPQTSLRIIRACSTESVTGDQLAQMVGSDPVLTAEILRLSNSAYFGLSRQVQSIKHAVNILGQVALRNIVLCVSVRDVIKQDELPDFDLTVFWEDALRRAVSARLLASLVKVDAEAAFTCGLLQDFGLLVLFYLNPTLCSRWPEMRQQDPVTRYHSEKTIFTSSHDEVIAELGQAWSLPDVLVEPLGCHHSIDVSIASSNDSNRQDQMAHILNVADFMCAVYTSNEVDKTIKQCRERLTKYFNLDSDAVDHLLATIPNETEQAAECLGLSIKQQIDLDEVLRDANKSLAESNLSYQELTWKLQQTIVERDKLAEKLNRELKWAREIQKGLLPERCDDKFPITGLNISANQLSGDFYDFFTLDDGRICFNIGDVSGKGVNAALLMAKVSSLYRCLGKKVDRLNELMSTVNNEVCETSIHGMFVTMIAGLFDPVTGNLQLINAGHPPALIIGKTNQVKQLGAQTPPIGIMPDIIFNPISIKLESNSLYLYTDGVTESRNASGNEIGVAGLLKLIAESKDVPGKQRLVHMTEKLSETAGEVRDDITLLLVERDG